MEKYRSTRAKHKKGQRLQRVYKAGKKIACASFYNGIILSAESYDRILKASVKACITDIEAAKKEDCEAFVEFAEGGALVILSSFALLLAQYGTDIHSEENGISKYAGFYGALQFFSSIVKNRIDEDFEAPRKTKSGTLARICRNDVQTLSAELAWTDEVFELAILRAAYWYEAPRTALVWISYLSSQRIAGSFENELKDLQKQLRESGKEETGAEAQVSDEEIKEMLIERARRLQIPIPGEPVDNQTEKAEPGKANEKTRFGQREEKKLFPGRKNKRERESQGIRSTALTHIAVVAAKIDDVTYKTPRLRSLNEAFDEAAETLFANDEILPASTEAEVEPIPKEIYGYVAAIFTDALDDLKAGGDGHVKRDIYSFCETLGLQYNARSAPDITKAFEQITRISTDFGDNKIRGGELSFALDPESGVIEFMSATLNEVVGKIKKHNTEVLKDPGKEFAPKNLKAELFRQKDTEAKNAIWQVIAPGFELRGLYTPEKDGKAKKEEPLIDYSISYRKIIDETDGFFAALEAARKKSRGFDSKFLKRKLVCIIDYLLNYTEYPQRYKDFSVYAVQPRKTGATILDSVLHIQHRGLNPLVFEESEASGADVK